MLFNCHFKLPEDANPEEVYRTLAHCFADVLKEYADMPLKESIRRMSDVLVEPPLGQNPQKIIGRWELNKDFSTR